MAVSSWRNQLSRNLKLEAFAERAWDVVKVNWLLGFTAFGGPPVHFKIFNEKFVHKAKWIDEQVYHELFSIAQVLSGPASTKLLYSINLIHGGSFAALLSLLLWTLPGAVGMFALSIGVSSIDDTLPRPAYAVLSGLNAAIVGVIALAAVELSGKAITDKLTRLLCFVSAAAGLLYNALWYFPVIMAVGGFATLVNDYRWIHRPLTAVVDTIKSLRRSHNRERITPEEGNEANEEAAQMDQPQTEGSGSAVAEPRIVPQGLRLNMSWKVGASIIVSFLLLFIVIMVLRATLSSPPLLFRLFANMLLAGTIIFGGGPVVIPLLREYVVAEGWVTPRDFLIGLALIQSFPGPNFNFAVFLGGLTAKPSLAGAAIAWVGIFLPGMALVHGTMGVWNALRTKRWLRSFLRGINAGATGLIYTAVYRIWQVGFIDEGFEAGKSLGDDPWWVVVTATAFVGGRFYGISAVLAIITGAVMGLVRYGIVVSRN